MKIVVFKNLLGKQFFKVPDRIGIWKCSLLRRGEIGEKLFRVTKKKANTQKRHTSWPSSIMHL